MTCRVQRKTASHDPRLSKREPRYQGKVKFKWTPLRRLAAQLLAEDELSDKDIARVCGVGRGTIDHWKHCPEFYLEMEKLQAEMEKKLARIPIARRVARVQEYDRRWHALREVQAERAQELQGIPGGSTGVLTHTQKVIGSGYSQQVVDEYSVDTGMLNAQLSLERQASQEVGQWSEKVDVTSAGKAVKAYIGFDPSAV